MPKAVFKAALLRHKTAPGELHFDWLLAPDDAEHEPDDRVLRCFRVPGRIDTLEPGAAFEAEQIGDHRWRYLTYEGDLTGGRGAVERVAAGTWTPDTAREPGFAGTINWSGGGRWSFQGAPIDTDNPTLWRFQTAPPERR